METTWTAPVLLKDMSSSALVSFDKLPLPDQAQPKTKKRKEDMRTFSNQEDAAKFLQQAFRRKLARNKVVSMLLCGWEKATDEEGFEFYFNPKLGTSSWTKPKLLGSADVLTPRSRQQKELAEHRKAAGLFKRAADMTEEDAALLLQNRFRGSRARQKVRNKLVGDTIKARDESGAVYYINRRTNHTSWEKPVLLRDVSESLLLSFRDEDSPRTVERKAHVARKKTCRNFSKCRNNDRRAGGLTGATKLSSEEGPRNVAQSAA
jgi:hypothetical protein